MLGKLKSGNSKGLRQSQPQVRSTNETSSDVPVNEQQQNRVILYFDNNQKIAAVPDGEVTVMPAQREKIVAQMRSGEISWGDLENFLRNVAMPLTDTKEAVDKVFTQIVQDLRQKQILAVLTGHNATDWQTVSREDLKNLRGKPLKGQPNYQTPVGFAVFRQKFLNGIADKADAEQMREYEQAMDDLERKIYGRRFDYYQQIRLMKYGDEVKAAVETVETPSAEAAVPVTQEQPTVAAPKVSGGILSQEQSLAILDRAVIMGDPWKQDGKEFVLAPSNLMGNGLVPAVGVQVGDKMIALSQPFQLSDGRGAALGFVPSVDGDKVRGFYLDQKTGLWHFAPDIIRGPRGEGMGQITEGYGEASTMLPLVLQEKLTGLVKDYGFREITTVNPDFLFAATATAYNTMQDYREELARGQMRSDFYREVDKQPVVINAQGGDKSKTMPQLLSVNANLAPNFQRFVGRFMTYSVLVGSVQVSSFRSHDDSVTWMFCSDEYGRTWIGGIEVSSPLTSTGCDKNWAVAGDLLTPLYETSTQAGVHGDPNDIRKGMVGMWNRYLSNVAVIREFLDWKNQSKM